MWALTLEGRFGHLSEWNDFLDEKVCMRASALAAACNKPCQCADETHSTLTPYTSLVVHAGRQGGDKGRVGHAADLFKRRRRRHVEL